MGGDESTTRAPPTRAGKDNGCRARAANNDAREARGRPQAEAQGSRRRTRRAAPSSARAWRLAGRASGRSSRPMGGRGRSGGRACDSSGAKTIAGGGVGQSGWAPRTHYAALPPLAPEEPGERLLLRATAIIRDEGLAMATEDLRQRRCNAYAWPRHADAQLTTCAFDQNLRARPSIKNFRVRQHPLCLTKRRTKNTGSRTHRFNSANIATMVLTRFPWKTSWNSVNLCCSGSRCPWRVIARCGSERHADKTKFRSNPLPEASLWALTIYVRTLLCNGQCSNKDRAGQASLLPRHNLQTWNCSSREPTSHGHLCQLATPTKHHGAWCQCMCTQILQHEYAYCVPAFGVHDRSVI